MPVKIRLRRAGRTHRAYFQLIAADSRMPRDGRFLEKLGTYDPNFDPPRVYVDHAAAMKWLREGAQMTDTARSLLSREGILLKYHHECLGDSPDKIAEAFVAWKKQQDLKLTSEQSKAQAKRDEELKARMEAETAIKNKRLEERAAREAEAKAAEEAAKAEAEAAKAAEAGEATESAEAADAAPEAAAEETAEAQAEAPAEEAKAESEAPAEEAKAEGETTEAPAEEEKQ